MIKQPESSLILISLLILSSLSCNQPQDNIPIDNLKWNIYLAMLNCTNTQGKYFYELELEPIKKVNLAQNIIAYEFLFYDKGKLVKQSNNCVIYSIAEIDSTTNELLHLTGENVRIMREDLTLRKEDKEKFKSIYQMTPNKLDTWLKQEIQKRLF